MNLLQPSFRSITYFVLTLIFTIPAFGQSDAVKNDLGRSFRNFDAVRVDEQSRTMKFNAAGRSVEIALTPHDIRAANYRAENTGIDGNTSVERSPVNTFIGTVNGDPRLASRMGVVNGRYEGFYTIGGEQFFVEPAASYTDSAAPNDYVVYRLQDTIQTNAFSCGSHLADKIEGGKALIGGDAVNAPTANKRIELATEADLTFVNTLGGVAAANAEIASIINVLEGLYSSEAQLSIVIVFQHSWTTQDPFGGANSEVTVRNFQAHWNANFPATTTPRDAAHLFSGNANLQGQGWAFIDVICNNPSFAYGMSGYVNFASGRYLIMAHEIAHNLGAAHVDVGSCANTLMNSSLTGATPLEFCQTSRDQIAAHVATSGSCLTERSTCGFDFDGDSKADISIFRPAVGEWWLQKSSDGSNYAAQFGSFTDRITPADFTGDGKTDIAFWRPSTGFWYVLRSEDSSFFAFPFGASGDTPVPADFDGDAKTDAAVFRSSSNTWFISRSSDGGTTISQFGVSDDVPVTADYDGDGRSDIAIFRPSVSQWWISRSTAGLTAVQFGSAGDKAVQGDYTGDGKADVAIWRPATGAWSILRSEDSSFYSFPFGASTDIPAPADYDGDGKFDATVFRPSNSTWFSNRTTAGVVIQQFGIPGDLPLPNAFVR